MNIHNVLIKFPKLLQFAAAIAAILAPMAVAAQPSIAVESDHAMVVTARRIATSVGLSILKSGGNAIDAAVAIGYALAVVDPCCGNIGGGGFMVIRRADGSERVIDFREMAPGAARRDMYRDAAGNPIPDKSRFGYLAAGVPGTVMGLDRALGEYGRLSRARVMAPAIRLARGGFVLSPGDAALLDAKATRLARDPAAARIFLRPDGTPLRAGDRLVQPDLAATLALIARLGSDAFYRGPIAAKVATAAAANGGILTAADFAAYTAPEGPPLTCRYRRYRIASVPPPSSGGVTLCEMLNVLSGWNLPAMRPGSAAEIHLLAETMRHAYRDRNTALGDPAFVSNPLALLLSPVHAAAIRAAVAPDRATPSSLLGAGQPPHEQAETTHYSVVDSDGNAVAVTYTINGFFGACVVAPGTGFLLNDEMDDFAAAPGTPNMFGLVQGAANAIAPGKRPLSSMTPTIVTKDGRLRLVLGSPGGPRITTAVLETLIDIVDFGMPPQQAVDAPRVHHQFLPDTLFYEADGLSAGTVAALGSMGYVLKAQKPWGAVELIAVDPGPPRRLYGANDRRRPDGAALGY
ncbi:MAG TPA: gamma-glutamyltransferase [Stellaceae bacterium]|nr:gamma-glutamyltransferase [Stellaceae bacterium]